MVTPEEETYIGRDHQIAAPVRRHKVLWIVLSLLLLALVIAFVFWRQHEAAKRAAAAAAARAKVVGITITTATAKKGNIGVYLDAIGTVTPVYTDSITSQVDGLVVAVNFQEGQRVSKGDPLIDIDPRPYRATLIAGARGAGARRKCAGASTDGPATLPRRVGAQRALQNKSWTTRKSLCSRTKAR